MSVLFSTLTPNNNLDDWTGKTETGSGTIDALAGGLEYTDYCIRADLGGSGDTCYVYKTGLGGSNSNGCFTVRFNLRSHRLMIRNSESFKLLKLIDGSGNELGGVKIHDDNDNWVVQVYLINDSGTTINGSKAYLPGGCEHNMEYRLYRSSSDVASDGYAELYCDGRLCADHANHNKDNYDRFTDLDQIQIGVVEGLGANSYGVVDIDNVYVRDDDTLTGFIGTMPNGIRSLNIFSCVPDTNVLSSGSFQISSSLLLGVADTDFKAAKIIVYHNKGPAFEDNPTFTQENVGAGLGIGMTDGTNQGAHYAFVGDNDSPINCGRRSYNDAVIITTFAGGGLDGKASFNSWLDAGMLVDIDDAFNRANRIQIKFWWGSEISAKVETTTMPTNQNDTKNLSIGFDPDEIHFTTAGVGTLATFNDSYTFCNGIATNYDNTLEQRCHSMWVTDASNPSDIDAFADNDACIRQGLDSYKIAITSYGSTTTIQAQDGGTGDDYFTYLAIAGLDAELIDTYCPTSDGDDNHSVNFYPNLIEVILTDINTGDEGSKTSRGSCGVGSYRGPDAFTYSIQNNVENGKSSPSQAESEVNSDIQIDNDAGDTNRYVFTVTSVSSSQVTYTYTDTPAVSRIIFSLIEGGVAPSITDQPDDTTESAGDTATFSVTADDADSYQWQLDSGSGFSNIAGATSSEYTTPATDKDDNGNKYQCVITNNFGSVTSDEATLTVEYAPEITDQPSSKTVTPGDNATFSITVDANPAATYQWKINTGSGWSNISGETGLSYTKTNCQFSDNGTQFKCTATNSEGSTDTNTVTLTVTNYIDRDDKRGNVDFNKKIKVEI